nr:MAG TPA: Radical SAM ThiC family [Caudoviricetes sp.]
MQILKKRAGCHMCGVPCALRFDSLRPLKQSVPI